MRASLCTAITLAASALAAKESVTVSKLSIHSVGSPVGTRIESVSFVLNGDDAENLKCSAKNVAFPIPDKFYPCGDSDYSFTLWEGEKGAKFRVMVYHDVGDARADLRGGADVRTKCDNSQGSGPADEICTQVKPVTFTIDGPVGISPGN
ncbi:major allergen alt [Fusarium longipes]|uniref:Major allergen alt n=1 Tax=Fusarium longipes TaxID=694270 RepID=A0A395SM36_9HYPO|nr:major allergen alt [Fusarium longipes]